jgi:hypothetical protein
MATKTLNAGTCVEKKPMTGAEMVEIISQLMPLLPQLGMAAIIVLVALAATGWQVRSQEKRWAAERKEAAYLECLKLLWQSRCQTQEGSFLNRKDFLGRMQTLQYVEPWLIVAGGYSASGVQEELGNAAKNLTTKIDLVRHEEPKPVPSFVPLIRDTKLDQDVIDRTQVVEGHGLPEEIDKVLNIVIKHCRTELGVR